VDDIIHIHEIRVVRANQINPKSTEKGIPPSGYGQIENLLDRIHSYDIPLNYRNIVKVSTRLYEGISRRHPFLDCNKRTAIVTVFETCLMNRYYLRKLNRKDEVDFSLKVASTDLDEFGFEEICEHFDRRIVPYKMFAAKRFANYYIKCPYCGSEHTVIPGKCSCGRQLMRIRITHHSILNKYYFIFTIKELSKLNRII